MEQYHSVASNILWRRAPLPTHNLVGAGAYVDSTPRRPPANFCVACATGIYPYSGNWSESVLVSRQLWGIVSVEKMKCER